MEVVATRSQRRARPRAVYAVVSTAGVFAILLAQLLLSITLSEGAYRIAALQSQAVELDRSAQVLTESLDTLRSPQNLAANAESLGMVANASPAYLRLADATVLGAPVAAGSGAGVLAGRDSMIGNVLLADVPLVSDAATGAAAAAEPGVATGGDASPSVASGPTAPTATAPGAAPQAPSGVAPNLPAAPPAGPATLPSPVTQ
ncbi:hypothetical protein [Microcella alkalica]|uniref:hypothetical protein n=1 Tax=Microcella alkalica TaxID=355930 RepID=UPI00145E8140|nr:hypothetical protein [Microcella alkalica]